MLQFYKPNPRNTGSACSIYYSTSNKCFFLQVLKQDGWNGKNGVFGPSRTNPQRSVTLKLSTIEAAGILLTLEKANDKFAGFHKYPGARYTTTITLEPYTASKEPGAYSLSIFKKDTQDSTAASVSFRIGLYAAEARLLREYLVLGLGQILLYRPEDKDKDKNVGEAASVSAPVVEQEEEKIESTPTGQSQESEPPAF